MMWMHKRVQHIVGCLIMVALATMHALSARSISNQKTLDKIVERRPFAVVMLYKADRQLRKNDKALYDQIQSARNAFKQASTMQQYAAANIAFLQANVAEEKLVYLPESFNVHVEQEPVYILFSNGLPVTDKSNIVIHMSGFLDAPTLKSFIDSHLYDAIEDYVDDKMERRAQERELAQSSLYFGVGGYPWYGYYPYYGGWGYPRYGYGPRVGFGFGVGF